MASNFGVPQQSNYRNIPGMYNYLLKYFSFQHVHIDLWAIMKKFEMKSENEILINNLLVY